MGCSISASTRTSRRAGSNISRFGLASRARSAMSSASGELGIDRSKVKIPLSERELLTLSRSWSKVNKDITHNGTLMFVRMFETRPEVKSVFEKFGTLHNTSEMWTDEIIKIHGMTVMSAIDDIILNMDDRDSVVDLMLDQGMSHAHFGNQVSPDIFWAIEEPFMKAAEEAIGENFSVNVKRIYQTTIHFILKTFVLGFNVARKQDIKARDNMRSRMIDTSSVVPRDSSVSGTG